MSNRYRTFEFKLWKSTKSYKCDFILEHIRLLHQNNIINHFAYILHDKDKDEYGKKIKPHYHLIVEFRHQHWEHNVHEHLMLPLRKTGFEYDMLVPKDRYARYRYLQHKDHTDKYQYGLEDIVTDNLEFYQNMVADKNKVDSSFNDEVFFNILDYIISQTSKVSTFELAKYCHDCDEVTWKVFCNRQYDYKIMQVLKEHNDNFKIVKEIK